MAFKNILNSKHVIITVNIDDEIKEHFPEMFAFEIQHIQAIVDYLEGENYWLKLLA